MSLENDLEKLQAELAEHRQKAQDYLNSWKRTAADFENYRKRKEEENKELLEFAKEVTVAKLLPTLDSLEQALKHMPQYGKLEGRGEKLDDPRLTPPLKGEEKQGEPPIEGGESPDSVLPLVGRVRERGGDDEFAKKYLNWQLGVNGIVLQLDKVLEEMGVKKIEALGKKFDPHKHEAVQEVEGEEDGTVVEELQSGFELNGKVIRPSQVVISKKFS